VTTDAARHETSAGGVVVRFDRGRALVLLIRDSYGHWGFPKGHVEAGEAPDVAALREVTEETGLDGLRIRAPLDTVEWDFRLHGALVRKRCHFFLVETRERRTVPQRAEGITACRWTSFEDAERLVSYENARQVLRLARALVPGA
jgi:8-oxo-dGTP pyrophosphatase MutT (NUDIX family)